MTEFSDFVMARRSAPETLKWLEKNLLKLVQEALNKPHRRARLGLYAGEVIPTNERNLTDTRNRVSLIYEYLLADEITNLLDADGYDELCAYVVANRFPDLEIRNRAGERGLRLEVKCLQSTAEEKAANFSTLLKDIDPVSDYLIVFLWEWGYDAPEVDWDRAPIISEIFAFNARALASLRDWYWLNRPGPRQGDAYQGYDLRGAITSNKNVYKKEEGNYGKLLRLWDGSFAIRPAMTELMEQTEADYLRFRETALHTGFENLSNLIFRSIVNEHELQAINVDGRPIGYRKGGHWFVLSSKIDTTQLIDLMKSAGAEDVVLFTDKYQWTHCQMKEGILTSLGSPRKPKHLLNYLNDTLQSS